MLDYFVRTRTLSQRLQAVLVGLKCKIKQQYKVKTVLFTIRAANESNLVEFTSV
jgi:hypothetical protein